MTAFRRPVLKIVDRTAGVPADTDFRGVQHDARGNAVWSVPVSLEDTGDLVLEGEQAELRVPEGDPYNSALPSHRPRKPR